MPESNHVVALSPWAGVGLDVVSIDRLAGVMRRTSSFRSRYFSPFEESCCAGSARPERRWARSFAVKEAFLKAIGRGVLEGIPLHEIEYVDSNRGLGELRLGPHAQAALDQCGVKAMVSVADDGQRAWAVVVLSAAAGHASQEPHGW